MGLPPIPLPGRPRNISTPETPPHAAPGRLLGTLSRTFSDARALEGLQEARKPWTAKPWTLGLVAGFASFWAPSLAGPKLSAFPSHFQGGLAGSGPHAPAAERRRPRSLGLGFLNNLVNHRKRRRGPLGGAPAPAPGGAAHALTNSLGLHSSSKQWCE